MIVGVQLAAVGEVDDADEDAASRAAMRWIAAVDAARKAGT